MLAVGLGAVQRVQLDPNFIHDLVPLDTVVDAILATPLCYPSLHKEIDSVPVVQVGSSSTLPLKFQAITDSVCNYFSEHPSCKKQFRKPRLTCEVDAVRFQKAMVSQRNQAAILKKVWFTRKIGSALLKSSAYCEKMNNLFGPFMNREWVFNAPNYNLIVERHAESSGPYSGLVL